MPGSQPAFRKTLNPGDPLRVAEWPGDIYEMSSTLALHRTGYRVPNIAFILAMVAVTLFSGVASTYNHRHL